jgi:hypothetical protein
MEISNFSEFLLEKKKDKSGSDDSKENSGEPKIWKPGSGTWFLEYYSQIKSEKDPVNIIKVTEEVLLKLAKEGFSNIDSSFKWEKLYQFAKYCLKGEKINYPEFARDKKEKGSKTEPGLLSEILEIDVPKAGKTIDKILGNDVKNDDLADYIGGIYDGIRKFIKESPKAKILFGDKNPSEFDDLGVISLLAGLYQPKNVDEGKPIFITESTPEKLKTPGTDGTGWNGTKVTDEGKKKAGDWSEGWNIPIDPLRLRTIMKNSEMCLRTSSSCIKEISLLFSSAEESDAIVKSAEETIEIIKAARETLFGTGEEKTGTMYKFWEAWEAADADKIKLIKKGGGFTNGIHLKFLQDIELGKNQIQEAKDLVDSGEMSMAEYFKNVEAYTEDKDDKKVTVGEGLRKVMYEEIKDGISDLQAAIENYATAPGEKNALDQYLKVYNEFINKAKSNYTITGKDAIEVKKK